MKEASRKERHCTTKRLLTILLIVLIATCFTGCKTKVNYNSLQSTTNIASIEIVSVGKEVSDDPIEQTVLATIDDTNVFLEDFNNMTCYMCHTDPIGINNYSTVIKITYLNGDYELIDVGGQAEYVDGDYDNYVGYTFFEEEQFNSLIEKYIE